jgi:hypothetical protein
LAFLRNALACARGRLEETMDIFDRHIAPPGGGRASSGGSFYHVSFRSGSRATGASAHSAHNYIVRAGEYGEGDRDPVVYTESDHMPGWATGDPGVYWEGADLYERANGRLYVSGDFALPRGLSTEDQVALAHAFAQELTSEERLPYTLAIHAGQSRDGDEQNPHAHLMISERKNDGVERDRDQWFSRAHPSDPSRGGAAKSRTFHGRAWVESARGRWAELTNETLSRLGRDERVDHRSYERQGVDREPGRHFGPAAAHMVGRGRDHDRLESAAAAVGAGERLVSIDREIAALEAARDLLAHAADERSSLAEGSSGSKSAGRSVDDDWSPGR